MLGFEPESQSTRSQFDLDYVAVKAPQFSFDRLKGAEPKLGVEMASTGEVASFGATTEEALLKAMMAAGLKVPVKGALLALDSTVQTAPFLEEARCLSDLGLAVFATPGTAASLRSIGDVFEVSEEDGSAHELLRRGRVDIVFSDSGAASLENRSRPSLQRFAIDMGIPMVGEPMLARRLIQSLAVTPRESLEVKPWKQYTPRSAPEERIKLFIRQPFTETSEREAAIVQGVLDVLQQMDTKPYRIQFLTGRQAKNSLTFRHQFERETGQKFTPKRFRNDRLERLNQADAIVVIRTGLSESTAFEIAYNIFGGPAVPIFFAIWAQAPIKTTLLRDLNDVVPVRYVTFSNAEELAVPLLEFLEISVIRNRRTLCYFPNRLNIPADCSPCHSC
jgi:carbamoyl-phosphate synthase large subunit